MPIHNAGGSRFKYLYVSGQKINRVFVWNGTAWQKLHHSIQPYSAGAQGAIEVNDQWPAVFSMTNQGRGVANISVQHSWGANGLQWVSAYRGIRLLVNGVQRGGEAGQNFTTGSWSTTTSWQTSLNHGDTVTIVAYSNSAYSQPRTITIGGFSLTPA